MSRISQADKQRMYELAEEIIECKRENDHREAMGIGSDSDRICRLYDLSDEEFRAERIKSLLDELKETQEENQRMRVAMRMQHATIGNPRKLFTCSACGAEGLDEPLESQCHCMSDDAHWIESVIYQPEKPNGPTA